jgi:hypothetical protein
MDIFAERPDISQSNFVRGAGEDSQTEDALRRSGGRLANIAFRRRGWTSGYHRCVGRRIY